eukprot:s2077_g19.t1
MVGEEEYEEEWQEGEEWYETNEGYWADDQTWNDGYWANEDLYYKDEYGYFQRKGKGKGKKGKKGKDDEGKGKPGDGKGKSNYVQPQTSSNPPIQQQQQAHFSSSAPSSASHGFLVTAETEPVRVESLAASYQEPEEHRKRRTRRGGQNLRDATAQRNREEAALHPVHVGEAPSSSRPSRSSTLSKPEPKPKPVGLQEGASFFTYGHSEESEKPLTSQDECFGEPQESFEFSSASFYAEPTVACENGIAFHNENNAPPTVCILDLGCTRAMGSRRAVEAFCHYVDSHRNCGLWYEIQPTSSRFFFANSQQSKCTEKLVIYMYDHGWNTQFTEFDIVEEGDVPLLMSLPQMRNLGFQFELTPDKE